MGTRDVVSKTRVFSNVCVKYRRGGRNMPITMALVIKTCNTGQHACSCTCTLINNTILQ